MSGFVLDAFFSIRAVSIRAFVPVVRAVLAPIAVAVLMGGRRDGALVTAGVAGRIRVIGVDVRGLVLDAFFSIRAVIVGAFVPVARAVLAPVAVAVLVGGRRDGALVAANIAGRIRVIGVDVRGLVRDAFFPIRAVIIGAFVPVARAVLAPIAVAVLMGGRRVFGYRNRQLLRIAARAVGSLDGEGRSAHRSGRAADLAGARVQSQVGRKIAAVNAPCDGRGTLRGKPLTVGRADRAAGQGLGGDGRRSDELYPDRGRYRRLRLLKDSSVIFAKHQRAGDDLPIRGLRVIGRCIPCHVDPAPGVVNGVDAHSFRQAKRCKGRADGLVGNGVRFIGIPDGVFDGVYFDGGLCRLVEARVVRREYHRHVMFTRRPEVERRSILEGECAGGDSIRTLDLCRAADERADFCVVGSYLELSPGEDGIVGQRIIAVPPTKYGHLRDLRLGRVGLKPNLSHSSEVGAFWYGEIFLQFGAVDFAVDGLLLKRIGVVGRAVPRSDDIHTEVHPCSLGIFFIAHRIKAE